MVLCFWNILLAGLLAISFVSCTNQDIVSPQDEELRFDIKVQYGDTPDTKAVKTQWEDGDKIFIFFQCTEGATARILDYHHMATLVYEGGAWNASTSMSYSAKQNLGTKGIMYAAYFPFANVICDVGDLESSGQSNGALNGKPVYSFFLTDISGNSEYTVTTKAEFNTLSGTLTLTLPDDFVFFYIDRVDLGGGKFDYFDNEKYRLSVEGVKPVAIDEWSTTDKFTYYTAGAGQPMWGYQYKNGIAFAGKIDDTWSTAASHDFIFFSDGDPAVHKKFSGVTLASHASVKLKAPTTANGWSQVMTAPTYTLMFDGLNWANWNLGSTSLDSFEYGVTFRWGEIVPSEDYASFNNDIIGANNLTGNYAIYDAARAYLGANWRMMTNDELTNLKNNNNTTRSKLSSGSVTAGDFHKLGVVVKGKSDPQNSILLRSGASDGYGYYWTSTAKSGGDAYYFWTSSDIMTGNSVRSKERVIRPIYIGPTN